MSIAQAAAEPTYPSFQIATVCLILAPLVVMFVAVTFIVLLLRHLRFNRDKLHDERLKMIEQGLPFDVHESVKQRGKQMHNAFWISFWMVFAVPSTAFSAAAAATERGEYSVHQLAIWLGAMGASIAAVVSAAVLMIYSRPQLGDDHDFDFPMKKPPQ